MQNAAKDRRAPSECRAYQSPPALQDRVAVAHSTVFVSVLTPTRNRAHLLERVWAGLNAQTCRNFEWIVSDDGSDDDTSRVVETLASRSDFSVLYIRASMHVGKARVDNEAVRRARGELLMWCDSDDWLLPHAVERVYGCWRSIPDTERDEYVGITALCSTESGVLIQDLPDDVPSDVTWNDLAAVHEANCDMLFVVRTSAMQCEPFPEVDLVIPESAVWTALGDRKTRVVAEPLKFVEYRDEGGVSFSGLMGYNRGRAHALAQTTRRLRAYPRSWRTRWWRAITFLRYCMHGDIGRREAFDLWAGNSTRALLLLSLPFAWALAAKDAAQGKVRKTHREFLAARDEAVITVQAFGKP